MVPEESFSEEAWRTRRFQEELAVRGGLALVVLVVNELAGWLAGGVGANSLTRIVALAAVVVNGPYYLAARSGRWLVGQAYVRLFVDIGFITAGLWTTIFTVCAFNESADRAQSSRIRRMFSSCQDSLSRQTMPTSSQYHIQPCQMVMPCGKGSLSAS